MEMLIFLNIFISPKFGAFKNFLPIKVSPHFKEFSRQKKIFFLNLKWKIIIVVIAQFYGHLIFRYKKWKNWVIDKFLFSFILRSSQKFQDLLMKYYKILRFCEKIFCFLNILIEFRWKLLIVKFEWKTVLFLFN